MIDIVSSIYIYIYIYIYTYINIGIHYASRHIKTVVNSTHSLNDDPLMNMLGINLCVAVFLWGIVCLYNIPHIQETFSANDLLNQYLQGKQT